MNGVPKPISETALAAFEERLQVVFRNHELNKLVDWQPALNKSALSWNKTVISCFPTEVKVYNPETNRLDISKTTEKIEWSTSHLRTCEDSVLDIGKVIDRLGIRDASNTLTRCLAPDHMEDYPRVEEDDMVEMVIDIVDLNLSQLPIEPLIGISLPVTVYFLVNNCNTLPKFMIPVFLKSLESWEFLFPGISLGWTRLGIGKSFIEYMDIHDKFLKTPLMAEENVVSGNAYRAWCEYATTRPIPDRVKNPSLAVEILFDNYKEKAHELYGNSKHKPFISLNLKYKSLICASKKSFF